MANLICSLSTVFFSFNFTIWYRWIAKNQFSKVRASEMKLSGTYCAEEPAKKNPTECKCMKFMTWTERHARWFCDANRFYFNLVLSSSVYTCNIVSFSLSSARQYISDTKIWRCYQSWTVSFVYVCALFNNNSDG